MCTSVILINKKSNWPLILGTNRDEYFNRKSLPPNRHWSKHPYIIGGLDKLSGGTWCAINDYGIIACIHNKISKINNFIPKESRGKIILKILKGKNIKEVLKIINNIDLSRYDGFNLFFANNDSAYWMKHNVKTKNIYIRKVPEGLSILTSSNLNDRKDKKINYYIKRINKNSTFNNNKKSLSRIELILKNDKIKNQKNKHDPICFNINNKFGTVSSAIICINKNFYKNKSLIYRYTNGPPNKSVYKNINLI